MHTLYCTPLGETVRDEFVAALAETVKHGRGNEQAFLLPSAHLLGSVRRDLRALGPAGYEQPSLLAFDDLVGEIAALAGCPHRLMDRMTQELVVAAVLDSLKQKQALPYFSAIASFPGYIGTVTSLLAEIKRTAAPPDEYPVGASGSEAKDAEVQAIYEAYQATLAAHGLADLEEMYFLAIKALGEGLVLPYKHIFISEFYILTPLQLALVRELKRVAAINIGLVYEKNREVFAAVEQTYTDLVGMGFTPVFVAAKRQTTASLAHLRHNLFADKPAAAADASGVAVVSCPTRAKEMTVAAARIKKLLLSGACRPADVAVVVRDTGAWGEFREICGQFGLPVSLAREERLGGQLPARLLVNMLTARSDGGSRHTVLNLLKLPLVSDALGIDADAAEQAALGRVIRSWRDWFGVFKGDNAPENLIASRRGFDTLGRLVTALPRQGTCAAFTAALKNILDTLRVTDTLGKAYKSGRLPLAVLQAGMLAWEKCGETLDAMAEGFALAGQADKSLAAADFLRCFRQALAGQTVRLEGYNDQAVQVVSPAAVRGVTFRSVFILGLTDGEFPLRERENWLYDDRERAGLKEPGGLYLATLADKMKEEKFFFAVAVALAGESLTISGREDAETLPSPYVAETLRLFAPGAVIPDKYSVVEIFPADYDAIFSARELTGKTLLDIRAAAGPEACAAAGYVIANLTDGDFSRRIAAEKERGRGPGPYDGLVGTSDGADNGPPVFSITALEDYAQCPFRYFATRRLKLKEWEEKEEEAGYDIIGNIYHEVLATFLRSHRGESLRPAAVDDYQAELTAALDGVCRRLAAEDKTFSSKAWDYRRRRIEATLRRWLEFELAEQNGDGLAFTPAYLEWGFGLPAGEGMDAASVPEPLELNAGGRRLRVAGKVDRIDAVGDKLAVVDYKRKYAPRFRDLSTGTDLQAALYIMAAERFLCPDGGEVAGGGYYSVENTKKEGGMWRAELAGDIRHRTAKEAGNLDDAAWEALQADIRRLVGEYGDGIRTGIFPVRPAADCPPYCIARTVCRYRPGDGRPAGGENDD